MPETTISKEITKLKFTGNTETVEENGEEVEKQIEYVLRDSRLDDTSVSFVDTITSEHGVFTSTDRVTQNPRNPALITGEKNGQHLEFDGNGIQSWMGESSVSSLDLNLNPNGGAVRIAGEVISSINLLSNKVWATPDGKQGIPTMRALVINDIPNNLPSAKIASSAITTAKIANLAVTTAKIADGAVTNDKIASNTITAGKIAAGAVAASEIATDAVTTSKIKDANVTEDKIKNGAVTNAKIASGISTSKIKDLGKIVTAATASANISSGSYKTLNSIKLTTGNWIIVVSIAFEANNSGRRSFVFGTANDATTVSAGVMASGTYPPATGGGISKYNSVHIGNITDASATYYCRGWQDSGSTLTGYCYLRAIKIS